MFRIKHPHTHLRDLESSDKTWCTPGPRDPIRGWARPASECLLCRDGPAVACCEDKGSGFSRSGRHGMWAPTQSHQEDNLYTVDQLYQRSSHTVVKVLRPQQIFQPGDLAKGLRNPREFDFEGQWGLITELPQDWGHRLLEGTKKPCVH